MADAVEYGQIVVETTAVRVLEAPEHALISVELLRKMQDAYFIAPATLMIGRDAERVAIVMYEIVGWHAQEHALIVKRVR